MVCTRPGRLARRVREHCVICERVANKVRRFDGIYGYTEHCMGCGSIEQDGCLDRTRSGDRPYWRGLWAEALPPGEYARRVREIERSYFEND